MLPCCVRLTGIALVRVTIQLCYIICIFAQVTRALQALAGGQVETVISHICSVVNTAVHVTMRTLRKRMSLSSLNRRM